MTKQLHLDSNTGLTTRPGLCPSCGKPTTFNYVGDQHWPPAVVAKTGLAAVMRLWTCGECHTTISEPVEDGD